jgi:hypothetical protein
MQHIFHSFYLLFFAFTEQIPVRINNPVGGGKGKMENSDSKNFVIANSLRRD